MFIFEERVFVKNVNAIDGCDEPQSELEQINNIRLNNPELSHFR